MGRCLPGLGGDLAGGGCLAWRLGLASAAAKFISDEERRRRRLFSLLFCVPGGGREAFQQSLYGLLWAPTKGTVVNGCLVGRCVFFHFISFDFLVNKITSNWSRGGTRHYY
jgi:hypothetical protein